jgi:nitrogenase molybdenum-iron protein alpha chain
MIVKITNDEIQDELISKHPTKVARRRSKQIVSNEVGELEAVPEVMANVRTIPGIITMRGCSYAGCKGVVLGPTRDVLQITHGPIGCGFYSWLTRRNQTRPKTPEDANYMPYALSTDMQDENIIFGGEKKLKKAIEEAIAIFKPKALGIFSTCPVGLIGDDVHAVAREMEEKYPDVNIFGFSCEGYKGVSQSAGHHIANNKIFTDVVGTQEMRKKGKYIVNLLGEYNIGGDAFEIDRIFEKCGITIHSTFSGNSTYDEFASAHNADLNLVMCHRSINYLAEMMEKAYGIPWFKVNLIGAESTSKTMRKIAQYFGDKELIARVELVIAEEMEKVEKVRKVVKARCEGKTAMIFVGGSRAHHYQDLFHEIGMKTTAAGYEFAHRDDYEGSKVLPNVKVDADSRNIEELHVEKDPLLYRERKTKEQLEELEKSADIQFNNYEGMMPTMENGSLIIDDLNHHEMEVLIEQCKPDIFCAGVKEKYVVQKYGIPMKQLHSYDYSGPYAGYIGAVNFYREIDRMINTRIWSLVPMPWEKSPELTATYAWE